MLKGYQRLGIARNDVEIDTDTVETAPPGQLSDLWDINLLTIW